MPVRWRALLDPINLAAYLAWAAIGSGLWFSRPIGTGALPATWSAPVAIVLHGSFLLLFLLGSPGRPDPRRSRVLVALQATAALALVACVKQSSAPVLMIVAMAQSAGAYRARAMALLFVVANAALYAIFRELWRIPWPAAVLAINASFQLFAMMAFRYAVTAKRARDALAAANAELVATRSLLAESVRDSERLRLSRELHDVAGHKLTALKLNLLALARAAGRELEPQVALCARLADELLGDLRGVVQQMRLHDGMDLREALQALARPFPKPRVHFELAGNVRPSLERTEAILRTAQEALTNAARHGRADNAWIRLRQEAGDIVFDVQDDGRATVAPNFGNGLSGMDERLRALGGQLRVAPRPGGGLHLQVRLPAKA